MTKWVDQKRVEMRIITCAAWQNVLDELEKPNRHFSPRHASTVLKDIAMECRRIEDEAASLVGETSGLITAQEDIIASACQTALETIKQKAV